ncbi:pyridoxal phosphate-dependent aminotransferase [Verrucomicrobiota bacterium]
MACYRKPHVEKMVRYQTSLGRDLDEGVRLDRNERVAPFPDEVVADVFSMFRNYSFNASPEAAPLYTVIARDLDVGEDRVFLLSGVTEGIRVLYDLCADPGDNVICLDPTYPMYWIYADMYRLDYRKFVYDTAALRPDLGTLYGQLDERTRFVIIPNPNLPIESCFSVAELREIAGKCAGVGATLVVDEAYHFFGGPSALGLVDELDNVLVFRTFSKAYGLAGLRIGFAVGNPGDIEYISKSRSIVESNTLSMSIAQYFLEHPEIRDRHVADVKEGAAYIQEELSGLGLRWHGGNFTNGILVFLGSKQESEEAVAHLKTKKIYIRGAFEPPFDSAIRVSIGPRPYMEQFMAAFKDWLG